MPDAFTLRNGWTVRPHPVSRGFRYGDHGERTGDVGFTADWVEGEDFFKVEATTEVLATESDDDDPLLNTAGWLRLADRLSVLAAEIRAEVETARRPELFAPE